MKRNSRISALVGVVIFLLSIAQAQKNVSKELPYWAIPNIEEGAEFYFSPDGKSLIGTAKFKDDSVHHIYTFNIDGTNIKRVNDKGEDGCSYFFPDGKSIIFTSTRDHLDLPKGNYSDPKNYPQGAELYIANADGSNIRQFTNNTYYDAEVSVSPDGKWVLFTRQIDGQLDLWKVRPDGSEESQITTTKDFQEGGAFFVDNNLIIYRAWDKKEEGKRGIPMTIYTINIDGSDRKQITHEPGTNWAPHAAPDAEHFVFVKVVPPYNFEVYLQSLKTGKQTRLTANDAFDGFPVVSPDGKYLRFDSNREIVPGKKVLRPFLMDISSLKIGKH